MTLSGYTLKTIFVNVCVSLSPYKEKRVVLSGHVFKIIHGNYSGAKRVH